MSNLVRIKFTVFIQCYLIGVFSLYLNDDCIVSRTSENGTCKFINDCPQIEIEARKSQYPTLCGFERTQQIICCPNANRAKRIHNEQKPIPTKESSRISAESACV